MKITRDNGAETHINLHLFVKAIVHNQAMRHSNSMGFHRMACNIGIVAHVGIVEVCNQFLIVTVQKRRIKGGKGCHD